MKNPIQFFIRSARKWCYALSVFAICISLISCEEWFGDDDDEDDHFKGEIVAEHLDTPWELTLLDGSIIFYATSWSS